MKVDESWWLGSGIYVAPVGVQAGTVTPPPAPTTQIPVPATTPAPAVTTTTIAEGGKRIVTFREADNDKTVVYTKCCKR